MVTVGVAQNVDTVHSYYDDFGQYGTHVGGWQPSIDVIYTNYCSFDICEFKLFHVYYRRGASKKTAK